LFENRIPPNLMILIGLPYSLKSWIGDFWLYKAYLPTDIGKNYSYWVQIFTDFVLVLCILASTQMANDLNLGMVNNGFVQTSGVQNDKCMMSVNSSIFLGWSFWHILTILKFNCDGGFSEVRRTTRNKSVPIEHNKERHRNDIGEINGVLPCYLGASESIQHHPTSRQKNWIHSHDFSCPSPPTVQLGFDGRWVSQLRTPKLKLKLNPLMIDSDKAVYIGSMYAIYGNIYHQYTPNVSIYTSTMDPMGYT
jgi:hypothetical protein